MKNRSPLLAAFLSLGFAVAVWYGTSAINKPLFMAICTLQQNHFPHLSITTVGLAISLAYVVVACLVCGLLMAGCLRIASRQPLLTCWRQLVRRYAAFFVLLPLVTATKCWGIFFPFLPATDSPYRLPEINLLLDFAYAQIHPVLLISMAITGLSAIAVSCNRFKKSALWVNLLCGVACLPFGYFIAYVCTPYFEQGKWLLLTLGVCYLAGLGLLLSGKKKAH